MSIYQRGSVRYAIILLSFQIILVIAPIPNWDLDNQSISSLYYEETIYDNNGYETSVKLRKEIKIEGGTISNKNFLKVGTDSEREVEFEEIESHYANRYGFGVLICPKGQFHPYDYSNSGYVQPGYFEIFGNWDLSCYDHYTNHFPIYHIYHMAKSNSN